MCGIYYSSHKHTSEDEVCIFCFYEGYYMNIKDFEIWKALYVDEFDTQKYLYHYTSAETAMKILHRNNLLFGKLSNVNDTTEAKIRISFDAPTDVSDKPYFESAKLLLVI